MTSDYSAVKLAVDKPMHRDDVGRGLLHSFYPGESTFFNQAVTEIDIQPKVVKYQ